MIKSSDAHTNGGHIQFLPALTIGAAVALTSTTPVIQLGGIKYLVVQAVFLYGAGGTTVKAFVQTSLDAGATWVDIMALAFTTAAAKKISAVVNSTALAAATVPVVGALTDDTIVSGLLGDRLRISYVSTGTYTGATSLAVDAVVKG